MFYQKYKFIKTKQEIKIYKNAFNWYFSWKILGILFLSSNFFWLYNLFGKTPAGRWSISTFVILVTSAVFIGFYLKALELHLKRHLTPIVTIANNLVYVTNVEGEELQDKVENIRSIHGQFFEELNSQFLEVTIRFKNGNSIHIDTIYNLQKKYQSKYETIKMMKNEVKPLMKILSKETETEFFINNSIKKVEDKVQ